MDRAHFTSTEQGVPVARIVVKSERVRALSTRHPWVRDSSVASIEGCVVDGCVVDLVSPKGKFLGRGIYNGHSRIRIRLYTWDESKPLHRDFWSHRLDTAIRLRAQAGLLADPNSPNTFARNEWRTDAVRLVNSEGDGLSGLVVDQYGGSLVVQVTSLAMRSRLTTLLSLLSQKTSAQEIYVRTEPNIARLEGIPSEDQPVQWREVNGEFGPILASEVENQASLTRPPIVVCDAGIRYEVTPWLPGQKTGLYLDQRENRLAAARYCGGLSVLDVFCHHGGFSLAALRGGAIHTTAYDASAAAIAQFRKNMSLNGFEESSYDAQQGEAFEVLGQLGAIPDRRFGCVILDPPKFARSRANRDEALRGYHTLNRLGIPLVKPEGFLVTCSCSGAVCREDFRDMLLGAASQAGREIRILEQRGAAADHPIALNCLEGDYLKCFICQVL